MKERECGIFWSGCVCIAYMKAIVLMSQVNKRGNMFRSLNMFRCLDLLSGFNGKGLNTHYLVQTTLDDLGLEKLMGYQLFRKTEKNNL